MANPFSAVPTPYQVNARGRWWYFRSAEHVERWLNGREPGATVPLAKLTELAEAWWSDRLAPDRRPHTRDQNQAILDGLGPTGPFWQLPQ